MSSRVLLEDVKWVVVVFVLMEEEEEEEDTDDGDAFTVVYNRPLYNPICTAESRVHILVVVR